MLETQNLVHTLKGDPYKLFGEFFLVQLELVSVQNVLTLNWTFTYCQTISALGLVIKFKLNSVEICFRILQISSLENSLSKKITVPKFCTII